MDVIGLMAEERVRVERLVDDVLNGRRDAVPQLCRAMRRHVEFTEDAVFDVVAQKVIGSRLILAVSHAEHLEMGRLIGRIEQCHDASAMSEAARLALRARDHLQDEHAVLMRRLTASLDAEAWEALSRELEQRLHPAQGREAQQDEGATSDGDVSWRESPQQQDPNIDRSVDAVIRRTHGA